MLASLRPILIDVIRVVLIAGVIVILGVGIRSFFVSEAAASDDSQSARGRLTRSRHRALGGVCGGVAEYFGWSAARTRLAYFFLTFLTGIGTGMLLYAALWFVMPPAKASSEFSLDDYRVD